MEFEGKKAVIYVRQSFGTEDNSTSIEQQILRCSEWCKRNGVDILAVCKDSNTSSELYPDSDKGHVYCNLDRAWKSWNNRQITANRKKFRKGLAEAFSYLAEANFFVVNEKTRFYRNPSPLSNLENFCLIELKEHNVALVDVETNKIDKLTSNIELAVNRLIADYEFEKLEERKQQSIRSRKSNISKGLVFSNSFGVEWVKKQITFNKEKRKAIKYIFDSIILHKSYSEILYTLNTKFLKLAIGKCFYESNIYNVVKNSIYCGYREFDGKIIPIQNMGDEAIISLVQWQKANQIVLENKYKKGKQIYNNEKKNFLPFSGLLFCGNCGKRLTMLNDNGIVYICRNTVLTKNRACSPSRIRTNYFGDSYDMLRFFQPLFLIYIFEKTIERQNILNSSDKTIEDKTIQIEHLKKDLQDKIAFLLENNINLDTVKAKIQAVKDEISEKEIELAKMVQASKDVDEAFLSKLDEIRERIFHGEELEKEDYNMLLHETVSKIIVYSDKLKISLKDGNSFEVPRIMQKHRKKVLPLQFIDVENMQWKIKYDSMQKGYTEEKTLIETDKYKITLI